MSIFVDTSALLAVLDADDRRHQRARKLWERLVLDEETLVVTNYVLVETIALVQHRLGVAAARVFQEDVSPMLTVEWIDEAAHRAGVAGILAAGRKRISLVDWVSFETMRRLGIQTAFVFDRHFREQGFNCLP